MTLERCAAEELAQEAFLRAMADPALFQTLTAEQQRAWLNRTARNLFID